jgi:hypothetical protein
MDNQAISKDEISQMLDIKFAELYERIKTLIVTVGITTEETAKLTTAIRSRAVAKPLKGDDVSTDPIARVHIKDYFKIKSTSEFLVAIVKSTAGEKFFDSVLKTLNIAPDSLKEFDIARTQKVARMANKIKHIWDTVLSKDDTHCCELNSIFESYKKNAANNVFVISSTYFIGCNEEMLVELEAGTKIGISY